MKVHNTHYTTLADYLDGRPQSFYELVDCFLRVRRRMIKLHVLCDESDVFSSLHSEYFAALCELSELRGYFEYSIRKVDPDFPWELFEKELCK